MRIDKAVESAILGIRVAPQVAKLKKATQGVEQIFVKQLLAQMRKTSTASEESYGMGMYKDMMDDALSEAVSKRGDFGVAKQMLGSLEPILVKQEMARMKLEARVLASLENTDLKPKTEEKELPTKDKS